MSLNYVTLVLDLDDGQGNLITKGTAAFTPSAQLTDAGVALTTQAPIPAVFHAAGSPQVKLLATDNSAPLPDNWVWTVTFSGVPGNPAQFSFALPFTSGSTQRLSAQVPAAASGSFSSFLPVPVLVPAPTGATATDTPAVQGAIAKLAATAGKCTLWFQDGTYQVDGNALVTRNCSDFTVASLGATFITQAPNTASKPNNTTGNIFTIADCTDFRVEGITFDGLRDTVAPLTPLTASASSGQPSVTVAAGQGARYQVGQNLYLFGGPGTGEQNQAEGFGTGSGQPLIVQSITAGGGSGGGDLVTFTTNLGNSYAQISSTAVSDSYGPYAYAGAYLTPYQCAFANSVAGRTLGGENQQNGLHLLSCSRFTVTRVTARNVWESGIKCGTGFATTSLTDGCSEGSISDCVTYHGYDQGVSLWVSKTVSVTGCVSDSSGWASVSITGSDDCTVTGNECLNATYRVPGDTSSGTGVAVEGGLHNQIAGNIIRTPYYTGVRLSASPMGWGLTTTTCPTTSAYLAAQTAAGTSVQVSATTHLQQGGLYSLTDGARTEAATVASIVDSTHVTFSEILQFSHASGISITNRVSQETVVSGNTIIAPNQGPGILASVTVRPVIKNNVIRTPGAGTSGVFGPGVQLTYSSTFLPSAVHLGGNGAIVGGNVVGGCATQGIYADSTDNLTITGNRVYGGAGTDPAIHLLGVTDSAVSGNYVSDVEGAQGIELQAGTLASTLCARLVIHGNVVARCAASGIYVLQGDSLTITGNSVTSCVNNGIEVHGITNSVIEANICNSNQSTGIKLTDYNGTTGCQYNRVTGNTTRDDATGKNVTTGATWTQQHGIVEASGHQNSNLFMQNECDANAQDQLTTVGAGTVSHYNILSGTISS